VAASNLLSRRSTVREYLHGAYWLLPAAVGVPLLVIALTRNSDPRQAGTRHRPRFHRL